MPGIGHRFAQYIKLDGDRFDFCNLHHMKRSTRNW
jgi:hypothetical protein